MSYESINELDKFSYEDCQITGVSQKEDTIIFTLEALIVGARNSQNTNYTESYADTATMVIRHAKITEFLEEGYNLYDAEDRLIEEIEDKPIAAEQYEETLSKLVNGFLFCVDCVSKTADKYKYSLEIDMSSINEEGLVDPYSTTYELDIEFDEVRITWDRYLNRVQK